MALRATFNKDPFDLVLDMASLKAGTYLVKGPVSAKNWHGVCDRAGLPHEGELTIELKLELKGPLVRVHGQGQATMERLCARTTDPFLHTFDFTIDESLIRPGHSTGTDDENIELESEQMDMGEYITQQVLLAMPPFPVKPEEVGEEVSISDGLDEELKEANNPFAVLKDLK